MQFPVLAARIVIEKGGADMTTLTTDEAFRLAVERYADTVYRVAVHAAPRREDAEDVVQDTYERLLRADKKFESEEHLKAWLIRVALNRCHDLCRAASGRDVELDEGIPAAASARVLASYASSLEVVPASARWRVLIPVRVTIHSSSVSTPR